MVQIVDQETVKSNTSFIVIDPSGNFDEGKGTTGYATFRNNELEDFNDIKSKDFKTQMEYWDKILGLIWEQNFVVCESYKLQPNKSMAQSWSTLETPQFIGVLRYTCWQENLTIKFQDPSCKVRFSDEILLKAGVFEKKNKLYYCQGRKTNDHMRDAIRHGLYYIKYKK